MNFNWPLINDNITEDDKQALVEFILTENVRLTQGEKVKDFENFWAIVTGKQSIL